MIDYGDLTVNKPLPKQKKSEPMTIGKLKKILSHFPDDFEVWASEQGGMYDTRVKAAQIHPHDKKHGRKRVIITHGGVL